MSAQRVMVGRIGSTTDDTTTAITRTLGTDTDHQCTHQIPHLTAPRALYTLRDGAVDNLISGIDDDELGRRMIALGRSMRRPIWRRLTRHR